MGFRSFCACAIPWLAVVLFVCVAIQAVLGGYAAWSGRAFADAHVTFVHVFELIPILIAVAGFASRDVVAGTVGVVLFVLIGAQYALIGAGEMVRPLHIANAFLIFGVALAMAQARGPWRMRSRQATGAATAPVAR